MPEEGPPAAEEEEETMPDDMYLQDNDARSSTAAAAAAAGGVDDDGFGADEQAMLAGGHAPSRWNRCRFCCRICRKMSSEKRHVREHIIKDHGLSMAEYEASYGDCEVHTEYFFCGICHAEVKHNLKNISLHLHNVHNVSPPAYEQQFGRLVEEHAVIGGGGPAGGGDQQQQRQVDAGSEEGEHLVIDEQQPMVADDEYAEESEYAASHFLTVDHEGGGGEEDYATENGSAAMFGSGGVPPEDDIKNPRNKFCRACNRDFNRRQAFVEHCRNIHNMKINFGSNGAVHISGGNAAPPQYIMAAPPPPPPPPKSTTPASFPCEFCGKVFSNRSNRNRHKILSCEARREHLQAARDDPKGGSDADADMQNFGEDDENGGEDYEYTLSTVSDIKCPYPDCDVTQVRSALMKRHLFEAHHIQNVSVAVAKVDRAADVKREPVDADCHSAGSSDEERKVPPLRVKLKSLPAIARSDAAAAAPEAPGASAVVVKREPPSTPTKEFKQCNHCPYRNRNHYILDRHEKACFKRKMSTESIVAKDQPEEDPDESEKPSEAGGDNAAEGKAEDDFSKSESSDAVEHKEEDTSICEVGEPVTEGTEENGPCEEDAPTEAAKGDNLDPSEENCHDEVDTSTEAIYGDSIESPEREETEMPSEPEAPKSEEEKVPEKLEVDEMRSDATSSKPDLEDVVNTVDAAEESEDKIGNVDAKEEKETSAEKEDGEGSKGFEDSMDGKGPECIEDPKESSEKF